MTTFIIWAALAWTLILGASWAMHTRHLYGHVKRHVKAEEHAADRLRAKLLRKHRNQLQSPIVVAAANPARHVTLIPRPWFIVLPLRRNIAGVIVRWTPVVAYPTVGWLDDLNRCVAHGLGVGEDDVFRARTSIRWRRTWIIRDGGHADVPAELPADWHQEADRAR